MLTTRVRNVSTHVNMYYKYIYIYIYKTLAILCLASPHVLTYRICWHVFDIFLALNSVFQEGLLVSPSVSQQSIVITHGSLWRPL